MICLHHNDLDGRAAGAIVSNRFPECKLVEMDYNTKVPWDQIQPDEVVIIVDFSLQNPGDWEKLNGITENLIWIDHHETAIRGYDNCQADSLAWNIMRNDGSNTGTMASFPSGSRFLNACGAHIAWRFFYPDKEIPRVLELIDKWDRWVHEDDPKVLNFVSGMEIEASWPASPSWWKLLFGSQEFSEVRIKEIQKHGDVVRQRESMQAREYLHFFKHRLEWEGLTWVACNRGMTNSAFFDSVNRFACGIDGFISYVYDGSKWTISLYSKKIKVNDIAVKYGGGGHPGAAGFVCGELPWGIK
jgi:uncharacterized protein